MSLLSVRIDRGKSRRCIVVGAGLSGLSVAAALCARGTPVLLLSLAPPLRARSASRHEGLGSTSLAAEDAPLLHAEDTLRAGAWLADGVPVQGLCRAAPQILEMFAHLGVPFERTAAGLVKGHQQFGHSQARVAHAGWNTGHHLVASLNALLSYYETIDARDPRGLTVPGEKLLRRLEHWDFVRLVRDDDGTVVGVVAQDLKTLQFKAFPADGVCLSSGGFSGLYPNACAPQYEIGAPLGSAASEGALLANPELIQLGLLNLGEGTRPRSLGASLLAYGARLFVVKAKDKREPHEIPEKERDYLLERPGQRLGASSTEASGSPEWALARQLCLRGPDSPRGSPSH